MIKHQFPKNIQWAEFQLPKHESWLIILLGILELVIGIYLELGIWVLEFKTPLPNSILGLMKQVRDV